MSYLSLKDYEFKWKWDYFYFGVYENPYNKNNQEYYLYEIWKRDKKLNQLLND